MPATAAFAAISASNAAIAAAEARRAEEAECRLSLQTFDAKTSTLAEQKQYAHCVQLLNPDPSSPEIIIIGKGVVAVIFICAIIGFFKGWGFWADEGIEGALIGAVGSVIVMGIAALVLAGICFLFS